MTKLPYGRFDAGTSHLDDDPWVNLTTVDEFLEAGQPLPYDLATWLGHAIRFSERNPDNFLRRLGLKNARGRPNHAHHPNAWLEWGKRIDRLEDAGEGLEKALTTASEEYAAAHGKEVSRSQLQKWRDEYRRAKNPTD